MIRPREILLHGLMDELRPLVQDLRKRGWPVEVRADASDGGLMLSVEVRLDHMPVPVEATGGSKDSYAANGHHPSQEPEVS